VLLLAATHLLGRSATCAGGGDMSVSAACQASLGATYTSVLGNCARTCMLLAASQPLNDGSALRAGTLGGECLTCEQALSRCGVNGTAAVDAGWITVSTGTGSQQKPTFRSSAFQCNAKWAVGKTASVGLRNLCYPSSCSLHDVTQIFKLADPWATNTTELSFTNYTRGPTCDIFGSFVDKSFPVSALN